MIIFNLIFTLLLLNAMNYLSKTSCKIFLLVIWCLLNSATCDKSLCVCEEFLMLLLCITLICTHFIPHIYHVRFGKAAEECIFHSFDVHYIFTLWIVIIYYAYSLCVDLCDSSLKTQCSLMHINVCYLFGLANFTADINNSPANRFIDYLDYSSFGSSPDWIYARKWIASQPWLP